MGDLNAHVKANDQDYITFDMNDVLDDFLPNNYIADTVHKKRKILMSITDYCICSANVLPNIVSFTVNEQNPILSDHCPVSIRLQYYNDLGPSSGLHKPKRKPIRDRPFNLQGGGMGFFVFFLNILIPNVAEKNF
jgi:hypothetical protein